MRTNSQRFTAVLLAAVLAMGAGIASAQQTVRIAIPDSYSVSNTLTDFIAVTGIVDGTTDFTSTCMKNLGFLDDDHPLVKVVVVDTAVQPAVTLIPNLALQTSLKPGTRLTNLTFVANCVDHNGGFNVYDATISSPQNRDVALVITPAGITLTEDHEGVVGAGTDELGLADAVCVKKGSPSIKTEIISDLGLEAGDRLTSFYELDFNPETGETLYACWLEY